MVPFPPAIRKRCLELLNRDVIPALREHGKKLGQVSPFDRAPGSVPLVRETGYATVSNPSVLINQKPSVRGAD